MQILRQLDVHPKVREEADILVRTFSGAVGKAFFTCQILDKYRLSILLACNKLFNKLCRFSLIVKVAKKFLNRCM